MTYKELQWRNKKMTARLKRKYGTSEGNKYTGKLASHDLTDSQKKTLSAYTKSLESGINLRNVHG